MAWIYSLRFKLVFLYALIVGAIMLIFSAYVFLQFRQDMIEYMRRNLSRRGHQIGDSLVDNIDKTGFAYIGLEIEARYAPTLNDRFILIKKQDGSDIYTSKNALDLSPELINRVIRETGRAFQTDVEVKLSEKGRMFFITQRYSARSGGNYFVIIGTPETDVVSALLGLGKALAIGLPLLIGLSVIAGYLFLGRALHPVNQVVEAAEVITLKNLSRRLPVPQTNDEFAGLARALNRMIDRLDEAFQLNNRFAEDASHELRTPLTIIRGELEILLRENQLSEDCHERLSNILEETERLTLVVEGLLMVSRLETGEAKLHKEVVDLGELVKNTADQMSLLSEDKKQVLSCSTSTPVLAEVDTARFKQVVVNLIDNAVKYTPEGGRIQLAVYPESSTIGPKVHRAIFEVIDTGVGISAQDIPHVFERFFRTDPARNSRYGGTGIGLSIVQSIVHAHGGAVHVHSQEGTGSRFWVELPLVWKAQLE